MKQFACQYESGGGRKLGAVPPGPSLGMRLRSSCKWHTTNAQEDDDDDEPKTAAAKETGSEGLSGREVVKKTCQLAKASPTDSPTPPSDTSLLTANNKAAMPDSTLYDQRR